jgi:hypothetical protein
MISTTLIALSILIIVHIIILIVIIVIVTRFFKNFWTGKIAYRTEKMLAVGMVVYFFQDTANTLFAAPIARLVFTLQRLYYTFYDYAVADDGEDYNRLGVTRPITEGLFQYDDLVQNINISEVLLAFGLILLLYHIFRVMRGGASQQPANLPQGSGNNRILIYNSVIAIVLAISLYFVISVFVAIPYLNEMRKPSSYTKVIVDSTLNNINRATQPLKPVVIMPLPTRISLDSILQIKEVRADYDKLKPKDQNLLKQEVKSINANYERMLLDRAKLISVVNNLAYNDATSRQNAVFKSGMTFQTGSTNLALDKATLYRDLIANFDGFLRIRERNYETLTTSITEGDIEISRYINDQIQRFSDKISRIARDSINAATYLIIKSSEEFNPYLNANLANYEAQVAFTVPVKDGSDWGLLGHISGYLIKAQSQDLIIIIGMIGFGILGASILSFTSMTDFFKSVTEEPVISNFPSVLARGFGAALIIYLATKGGLAIFSGGATTDPNGYILLLTCFIGAVFSEKVWDKATVVLLSDPQRAANGQSKAGQS